MRRLWLVSAAALSISACSSSNSDELAADGGPDGGDDTGLDSGSADGGAQGGHDASSHHDAGKPDAGDHAHDASAPVEAGTSAGDAGADAALACGSDGTSCTGADGSGVCCQGACVLGECCTPADCGGGDAGTGAGFLCVQHQCENVAGSLTGLLWQLPCSGDVSPVACTTIQEKTVSATLGGTQGIAYDVTLRFRGVVEQKTHSGGCAEADSMWLTGGTPAGGDTFNIYRLEISSPHQVFYLNNGSSSINRTFALDFQQSIRMNAGATVTLYAASLDNQQIQNLDDQGHPISVAGTQVTQPYDGQFIQMDVLAVEPDPVQFSGGSGVTGVLNLNGSQYALAADTAALRPADVTVEGWYLLAGAPSVYASLVGKPFGPNTADSYTIWYQSGSLLGGGNLSSTSGAASVPANVDASTWHHAAVSFDSTAQLTKLYVDGLLVSCVPAATPPISYDVHPLYIGADIDNGSLNGYWQGSLDEVRVFSSVRSAAQIWADMHTHKLGPTASLVGEWTFDETSGQVAVDSSGSGNDATLGATSAVEASDPTFGTATLPY